MAHDGNHAAGRALSAAVHAGVPEADGFLFASRLKGDASVAVFDRAFGKRRVLDGAELIRHVEFLDALDDYDIVLTDPAVWTSARKGLRYRCGRQENTVGICVLPDRISFAVEGPMLDSRFTIGRRHRLHLNPEMVDQDRIETNVTLMF